MEEVIDVELDSVLDEIEKTQAEKKKSDKDEKVLDLMKAYLREISKKSGLLTLEEEIDITWKVWNGKLAEQRLAEELNIDRELLRRLIREKVEDSAMYWLYQRLERKKFGEEEIKAAKEKLNPKNLTKEQKILLNTAIEGEFARKKLIEANIRLVVTNAKSYRGRGLELIDMIQDGTLGLIRAVEKFDPRLGNKFSTYATWWIKQSISRAIADHGRTIRYPVHIVEALNRMSYVVFKLRQKLNRNPTIPEIAEAMGPGWNREKVESILRLIKRPSSLEEPVKDNSNREVVLGDLIESDRVRHPEETTEESETRKIIMEALNKLDPKKRLILMARSGMLDGRKHTLEEIGVIFGVTRERARQLESDAIREMKILNVEMNGALSSLWKG